ncbi:MAG: sulfur oxidation c-type cytochrome SoxX [Betaproteobacteria bacterium]|nr:sulfur oxidation c-type cytochrome SoxX [Betaproteobacteria bacterium]MDE2049008.1 sulfur oxidation c-type cytochrome SoxX [Betaproteobacteria bacterium]
MNRQMFVMLSVLGLAACAVTPGASQLDAAMQHMLQTSFRDQGQASVSRLKQDDTNRACSAADVAGKPLDEGQAKAIEAANLATVRQPSDGHYLGDWKAGEKLAQSGRGMTWSDKAGEPNGANCYNCHQISKAEISYGTLGPSLYHYGKLRGVTDPDSAQARPVLEYTWAKLWNAKAFNACSGMPRFGHEGILTEHQLKDVMALLLDPKSPVNQ